MQIRVLEDVCLGEACLACDAVQPGFLAATKPVRVQSWARGECKSSIARLISCCPVDAIIVESDSYTNNTHL